MAGVVSARSSSGRSIHDIAVPPTRRACAAGGDGGGGDGGREFGARTSISAGGVGVSRAPDSALAGSPRRGSSVKGKSVPVRSEKRLEEKSSSLISESSSSISRDRARALAGPRASAKTPSSVGSEGLARTADEVESHSSSFLSPGSSCPATRVEPSGSSSPSIIS